MTTITPTQQNRPRPAHGTATHSAGVVAATANNARDGWSLRASVSGRQDIAGPRAGQCGGAMSDVADAIQWSAGLAGDRSTPPGGERPQIQPSHSGGAWRQSGCRMQPDSAGRSLTLQSPAGSVVVAAAGNEGSLTGISAPANCNNVIAVTAHSINGENASYSNIDAVGGRAGDDQCTRRRHSGSPWHSPAAGAGIDDPAWDGYYIWSTDSVDDCPSSAGGCTPGT